MEEKNFEEMRNQFAILKNELKQQEIVNDRLLRDTMKSKNRDIDSTKRMMYGCAGICLVAFPLNYYMHTWSLPFTIATLLMILCCTIATYYIHKPVDELNYMRDDFATVARVMAKFKKQYNDWLHYVAPVIIVPWIAWACYDLAGNKMMEGIDPIWMCLYVFFGAAIGAVIGYHYHCKAVNAAQDILDQIEE